MPLSDGTRLGSYEILSALGAGGMGEVYAAIDPRLGRKIALKVLPAEFAADPDRAARFEREARAIAALNHPNIVTVHSVETLDGLPVLTMELVDGRTLADLIPKQGLALDKFLQIAVPLADAIGAAHEKGITHRDLKPTNVMVTPEGRVKVLDFGLAKLRGDTTAAQLAGDPTRTVTTAGHIVGTVAYMSPEQAEARAVDERSDIFSLGIVLYEMATGQRPFKGDTNVSVLASIVRDTPRPIADVRPDLPGDLVKIVRKALAKDPERRYQSAKDLRNDLDIVREDAASGGLARPAQAAPTRGNRAARVWFAAAAVLGALATAVFLRTRLAEPHSGASVEATFTQLTFQPGMERFPSLSPDGKWIVYSAAGEGDEDIYLQSVSGQNAIDLTKDSRASDTQPVFSPDGERIAFRSEREGGGLFLMGRTGEAVRRLTRSGFTPTWSPDGRQIGYSTADSPVTPYSGRGLGELWVVDVGTGASRKISVTGDVQGGRQPAWSPDGAHIAFRSGLAIWTVAAGGGVATRVSADGGNEWLPVWSRDGRYIYCSGDRDGRLNLWRTPVDARTGRRTGAPERIAAPAGQATYFSISADGKHIAYSSLTLESNVQRVPIDGETLNVRPGVQWLTQGTRYWQYVRVSPDANLLALSTGLARFNELFVAGADGMSLRQVTPGGNPEWLPDGRTIIFGAEGTTPGGLSQISSIAADGSGLAPRIESGATGPVLLSADGNRVILHSHDGIVTTLVSFDIRTVPARVPGEIVGSVTIDGSFEPTAWSPDGRSIAGYVNAQPGGILVFSLTSKTATRITTTGERPRWIDDARLLYSDRTSLRLVDVRSGKTREIVSAAPDYIRSFDISPNRRWLYLARGAQEADIWLATIK